MKRSKLLLLVACGTLLASCGNNTPAVSTPSAEEVCEAVLKKTAIAIWADTGAPINQALTNKSEGAHAPLLSTSFTVSIDKVAYKASLTWNGIDGNKWKQYKVDDDHIVVIATRQSAGGDTLEATLTPTVTFNEKSVAGKQYKFTCAPYDVDPIDKTLPDFADGFFVQKNIKNGAVVRTKGVVTFNSPDYSSVIIQDGASAVQLYRGSAFSTFYTKGASLSVVGKIKDYSGLEYDPVLDVSPTDTIQTPASFEPTKDNIEAFRAEWVGGNKSQANRLVEATLEVSKDPVGKVAGETDPEKQTWDTLYLKGSDGEGEIALYTKTGYAGDDGFKEISKIIGSCKAGDKVRFRGALTYYSGKSLVECNIYSPSDIEKLVA